MKTVQNQRLWYHLLPGYIFSVIPQPHFISNLSSVSLFSEPSFSLALPSLGAVTRLFCIYITYWGDIWSSTRSEKRKTEWFATMCGILAVFGCVDSSQAKRSRIIELSRRWFSCSFFGFWFFFCCLCSMSLYKCFNRELR